MRCALSAVVAIAVMVAKMPGLIGLDQLTTPWAVAGDLTSGDDWRPPVTLGAVVCVVASGGG